MGIVVHWYRRKFNISQMPINPSNLDMSVFSRATLSFQDRLPKPGHVQYNGVEGKIQSQIQFLAMISRSDLPTII